MKSVLSVRPASLKLEAAGDARNGPAGKWKGDGRLKRCGSDHYQYLILIDDSKICWLRVTGVRCNYVPFSDNDISPKFYADSVWREDGEQTKTTMDTIILIIIITNIVL